MALRCVRIRSKAPFGPWNCVVHELASEQLAAFVVNSMLVDSLSKTLNDSSMHLACDEQRIDDVAAIVDRDIAPDGDFARLLINIRNGDVRTEGIREVRRFPKACCDQAGIGSGRQFQGSIGGPSNIADGNGLARFVAHTRATSESHVVGIEQHFAEAAHLCLEFLERKIECRAANSSSAAAECANAVLNDRSIAVEHDDIVDADTKLVGSDLGECSFFTLAVRRYASQYGNFAARLNFDGCAFPPAGGSCG